MLTPAEDRFHHLATCISNLQSALETLRTIRDASPDNPLIPAAFRFALVQYASPFTTSQGQTKRHILDSRHVPPEYVDLHNRIVTARHKVHAHSDLTLANARFKATGTESAPSAEIQGTYIDELAELPNIGLIIAMLNESIGKMYDESHAQLAALNS